MLTRTDLKIDFVAPPFAGHLFPQLQLAQYAKTQGYTNLRMFSCPCMQSAVEKGNIEFLPILADRETDVLGTSHRPDNVMSSIKGMLKSVTMVLDFSLQMEDELRRYWQAERPDLIIIDFLSPFAAVIADELEIPWWTAIESPTFIEAQRGTPAFFGGWQPTNTLFGKCRDALGRSVVRQFKKFVFRLYRKPIQSLGFKSIYREDGTERMYSNEIILGLGIPELQFENVFPKAMHWIGPCPASPPFNYQAPAYESGKKHILVSLGTQIPWAKKRAENVFRDVASMLPEYVFHFVLGNTELTEPRKENNLHFYGYLPYTLESFRNYDAIVHHGGIGVMYATIIAGIPQLVWPQDFDQHDNAAQIAYHGLGLRSRGKPVKIVEEIKQLIENEQFRKRTEEYRQIIERYQPEKDFVELLQNKFP